MMPRMSLVSVRDARERTISLLSELFAANDLELDEFERRVSLVHRAATIAEIDSIVVDLPKPTQPPKPVQQTALVPASSVRPSQTVVAVMGGVARSGPWTAPRKLRVIACMGGADLDFREARLGPGLSEVTVFGLMGGVSIIVPPGLAVETNGIAIMGGFEHVDRLPAEPEPDRPVLRIHGFVMMGGVSIETRLIGESGREARRRRKKERKARP